MKPLLALALIFSLSSLSRAEVQVTELFRAETPEELEAALVDGYPMPWLAEVLADSTIPEEDRYWLDCRMRAAIAQDLHMFFDEDGDPVRVDADWIRSGEDYWRECFVVNGIGDDSYLDESNTPVGNWGGYCDIFDHFGNETGSLAICPAPFSWLQSFMSRDGTVAVAPSGIQQSGGPGAWNVCFLKSDGSFVEYPIHGWGPIITMSQNGDLIAASCGDQRRNVARDQRVHKLQLFNGEGDLLFERILPEPPVGGIAHPVISPDSRMIAVPLASAHFTSTPVILFNAQTGDELFRWEGIIGNRLRFSPNSRYLAISGRAAEVVDCITEQPIWTSSQEAGNVHVSSDGRLICWVSGETWVNLEEAETGFSVDSICRGRPTFSPNAFFLIAQRSTTGSRSFDDLSMYAALIEAGE